MSYMPTKMLDLGSLLTQKDLEDAIERALLLGGRKMRELLDEKKVYPDLMTREDVLQYLGGISSATLSNLEDDVDAQFPRKVALAGKPRLTRYRFDQVQQWVFNHWKTSVPSLRPIRRSRPRR